MNIHISRHVKFNAIFLHEIEIALYLEIMTEYTCSTSTITIEHNFFCNIHITHYVKHDSILMASLPTCFYIHMGTLL